MIITLRNGTINEGKEVNMTTNEADSLLSNLSNSNEINNADKEKPPRKQIKYTTVLKRFLGLIF